MKTVIYKLLFPNGKVYIGQTVNLNRRMSNYRRMDRNINKFIKNAIMKYGWNNIKSEVLMEVDSEYANWFETSFISGYNSTNRQYGYNILGQGSSMIGYKHTNESKHIISERSRCRVRTVSEKEKHRLLMLGDKNPMYGKCGDKNPFYGKKHTEEVKDNIRRKVSGENGYWFGKVRTEHSEKMSGKNNYWFGKRREDFAGENNPSAKLSNGQRDLINHLFLNKSNTAIELSKIYNVSKKTIYDIVKSKKNYIESNF